jgi:3-oxoacyl-[acyl-carrier protein] reductase
MKLANRFAIITGAGQGLGAAIAERFVSEGASVMLCARNEASLQEVRARLQPQLRRDQEILIQRCDVANRSDVDELIERSLAAFPKLDILVNNAGVYGPFGLLEDVDWDDWVTALAVNIMGTVYPCRSVLPHFKRQHYGKIINLSGGGATNPLPRISAYAASKAAVVRFTEGLALEVKESGVDVNAIAPGMLATRLTDQLIAAGPERVGRDFYDRIVKMRDTGATPLSRPAELCVYLASAASDGISGKLLSAVWDPWSELKSHLSDLDGTDIYTLRRIVPSDRGKNWGAG